MRIAYTSDLHYDALPRNPEAIERLAAGIKKLSPDVVVLAGDLGDTLGSIKKVLNCFTGNEAVKLMVPGNHDLWVEPGRSVDQGGDSGVKHSTLIPALAKQLGFNDLGQGPVYLDDVAFVGSLGWYDYSLADPRLGLTPDEYETRQYGGRVWWDHGRIKWRSDPGAGDGPDRTDRQICVRLAGILESHLDEAGRKVSRIVAVIHTCPSAAVFERSEEPRFFDAYQGSSRLGDIILSHRRVGHCITGHKHTGGDWRLGRLQIHRRILGSVGEEDSLDEVVDAAIGVIDI